MAIKSIPKDKVQLLIKELEEALIKINEISKEPNMGAVPRALGYAEGTIEILIKKLNGTYSI